MATGLIALLDDVAGIAKVAAASLDDVAAQATKAGAKAAGVVIDDAAVTPRYVVGFAAQRELSIIWRIALGSLRNKLLILLPAALLLNWAAPWAITPLLMIGGLYLCYEGAEKVYAAIAPHAAHAHEDKITLAAATPEELEAQKVAGAIRTDFILSAEIMAIALAAVPETSFLMRAAVLAAVGLGITALVYGAVALIVKADDAGVALARHEGALRPVAAAIGRGLVAAMPWLLAALSAVGAAAMIWVGGGIVLHGLHDYGLHGPAEIVHALAEAGSRALPAAAGFIAWLADASASALLGLVCGALLIPVVHWSGAPLRAIAAKLIRRS